MKFRYVLIISVLAAGLKVLVRSSFDMDIEPFSWANFLYDLPTFVAGMLFGVHLQSGEGF